ncbi:hypothetical protein VPH35_057631 [Triticum aestivum]
MNFVILSLEQQKHHASLSPIPSRVQARSCWLATSAKKWANATRDDPPSFQAAMASSLFAATRALSSLPSSESMTSLTLASTSPALTSPCCHPTISTAIPMSPTMNSLFIFCSAYSGQHSIGTPAVTPSSTEFHPQCVTNAPVALWRRTSACGAHSLTTRPRPLVRSMNPSGRSASMSGSAQGSSGFSGSSLTGARTTHRKRWPDLSSPTAISLSCSSEWFPMPMLPKQRNTTLRSGWPSSQGRHSCRSFASATAMLPTNGPTQYTGGNTRPRTHRGSLRAATPRASNDSSVFTSVPSASRIRGSEAIIALYLSLSGSSSSSAIRCEAGMGGRPKSWRGVSPSSLKLVPPSARSVGSWAKAARTEALEVNKL